MILIGWVGSQSAMAVPAAARIGRPRIFVSHGTGDRTLPVPASRLTIVPTFEADGYDVTYVEFEGAHEVPREIGSQALD